MKKFIYICCVVVLVGIGAYLYTQSKSFGTSSNTKQFITPERDLSFTYPTSLSLSQSSGVITLSHDIAFAHKNFCDLSGEDIKIYPRLTDFSLSVTMYKKNLVETVKEHDPHLLPENFTKDSLVLSEGFIDAAQLGSYYGFSINEGVEGCGRITYYIPITESKTLVIVRKKIGELSPVASKDLVGSILKVPGSISPERNDAIFTNIVNSLTVK
jgi:hypothetical protein